MTHSDALEKTIDALDIQPIDAALVELCRVTARQMDASGGAPSTRLAGMYLSMLRNLRKVRLKSEGLSVAGSKLAQLRDMHGTRSLRS